MAFAYDNLTAAQKEKLNQDWDDADSAVADAAIQNIRDILAYIRGEEISTFPVDVTDLDEVTRYTRDYLVFMRRAIGALIEQGGSLADIAKIDQSSYAHLDTFDELARLNASMIFRSMEFE